MKTAKFVFSLLFSLFLFMSIASAIPKLINLHGKLTDKDGNALSGTYTITFKIYNVSTGGTALWTETQSVTADDGIFSVLLGSVTSLDLPFDEDYWLGITVGTDNEMTPRVRIASAGYAYAAEYCISSCGGTGGGYWNQSGSSLYPSNTTWNVGIGTTSPSAKLSIRGDNADALKSTIDIGATDTRNWHIRTEPYSGGTFSPYGMFITYNGSAYTPKFVVGRGETGYFTVDTSNGNVGIGTTSPGAKLDVAGDISVSEDYFLLPSVHCLSFTISDDTTDLGTQLSSYLQKYRCITVTLAKDKTYIWNEPIHLKEGQILTVIGEGYTNGANSITVQIDMTQSRTYSYGGTDYRVVGRVYGAPKAVFRIVGVKINEISNDNRPLSPSECSGGALFNAGGGDLYIQQVRIKSTEDVAGFGSTKYGNIRFGWTYVDRQNNPPSIRDIYIVKYYSGWCWSGGGGVVGHSHTFLGTGNAGGLTGGVYYHNSPRITYLDGSSLTATADGNVGIGTTSPGAKLDVNGVTQAQGYQIGGKKLWQLVYVDSFDDGTTQGWSGAGTSTCREAKLLGGYNKCGSGCVLTKTYDLTGIPHSEVMVKVSWWAIDSWDENSGDRMYIELDDVALGGGAAKYAENQASGTVCGGEWGEYGPFYTVVKTAHSANSLKVDIVAALNQAANDESLGVDSVEVWVK